MAVVIRLQGLIITAGSEDIRNFFTGLKIPDGGVHIVGGEMDEAFIIFASDEDARRAMTRSEGCIKGSPVRLLLSSKSEMQSVLESSSKIAELNQKRPRKEDLRRREINSAPTSHVKNLPGDTRSEDPETVHRSRQSWLERNSHNRKAKLASAEDAYLFLNGLPFSVTEEEVKHFFQGLPVDGIILLKNDRGQNNGKAVVKFRTILDAREGQKRDLEYIGTRFVEIYASTKQIWLESGGDESTNVESRSGMPPAHTNRNIQNSARSRSPLGHRRRSTSPSNEEFCVLLENLSYSVDKRNIQRFFSPARLQDDQILYLLDSDGRRTRSVFVLFRSLRDYCAALTRHKEELSNRCVYISPISREKMISILESSSIKEGQPDKDRSGKSQERSFRMQSDPYDSDKVCLYVRNMPFDVRKVEIMDFFHGFNISEDTVVLLRDDNGAGLGEALVVFRSEEESMSAQSLNGQRFLGSEVMLKCISRFQMQEFGVTVPLVRGQMPRERSPETHPAWTSEASQYRSNVENSNIRAPPGGSISRNDLQVHIQGSRRLDTYTLDSYTGGPYGQQDRDTSSVHSSFDNSAQQFDGPTCLKLINLPPQIRIDEIYDFCYGYRVIPGSVSLQYDKNGVPKGSATAVFESRQEALTAIKELSGRPIGTRKIKLFFV